MVVTTVAALRGMNEEATQLNSLTERIIEAAIAVHRALGPGLLESPDRMHEAQMVSEDFRFESWPCFELQRQEPAPAGHHEEGEQLPRVKLFSADSAFSAVKRDPRCSP
jgi:hypothetical protein